MRVCVCMCVVERGFLAQHLVKIQFHQWDKTDQAPAEYVPWGLPLQLRHCVYGIHSNCQSTCYVMYSETLNLTWIFQIRTLFYILR